MQFPLLWAYYMINIAIKFFIGTIFLDGFSYGFGMKSSTFYIFQSNFDLGWLVNLTALIVFIKWKFASEYVYNIVKRIIGRLDCVYH